MCIISRKTTVFTYPLTVGCFSWSITLSPIRHPGVSDLAVMWWASTSSKIAARSSFVLFNLSLDKLFERYLPFRGAKLLSVNTLKTINFPSFESFSFNKLDDISYTNKARTSFVRKSTPLPVVNHSWGAQRLTFRETNQTFCQQVSDGQNNSTRLVTIGCWSLMRRTVAGIFNLAEQREIGSRLIKKVGIGTWRRSQEWRQLHYCLTLLEQNNECKQKQNKGGSRPIVR